MNDAKRYDENKNRLDLVPPILMEEVGKVLTFGCRKYHENDWLAGMKWSKCIASLKRHLMEFEKGNDIDSESGEYHLSHLITNAMFLLQYYTLHPEKDDRPHHTRRKPRVSLDLDDTIVSFIEPWCELHKYPVPESWIFDREMRKKLSRMELKGKLDEFYLNLEPKCKPNSFTWDPYCYITARPVSKELCEQWLDKHGFPAAPVYNVGVGNSKLPIIEQLGIDIHIDDNYDTYRELNLNGICCYLFDALHNRKFSVGYRRVYSLSDLKF
jgi:hypothetical protein